jgi:hypothetical protein
MARKRISTKKSTTKPGSKPATLTSRKAKAPVTPIHRFAHPFFTTTPVTERKTVPGVGKRMTDHIEGTLLAIPNFLHLGDVNYYDNTDSGYHEQFYVPYKLYPGKIIAIPGNHDGELFKYDGKSTGQTETLQAFQRNFVQSVPSVPAAAGSIYRQMVGQPGVYWLLNAPFVDIVGLYSNVAENPGFLSSPSIGTKQTDWLGRTLSGIAAARQNEIRKALFLAVHHPPFSDGSHTSSTDMLAEIDRICQASGIMPDVVLAAHSHDYQAYTRYVTFRGRQIQIPFLVAGGGGRGLSPDVARATGARTGDHSLDKSLRGYGYLKLKVASSTVTLTFNQVASGGKVIQFDQVNLDLETNKVSR